MRLVAMEAKAARIWAVYEAASDITLAELRAALATEEIAAVSTLWLFLARHRHRRTRPTLKPGDVVILDNLPAHKSVVARMAIEVRGHGCFSFRRTRLTSTRSKTPAQSRRPYPRRPVPPSTRSRMPSAPTTSPLPVTMLTDPNFL